MFLTSWCIMFPITWFTVVTPDMVITPMGQLANRNYTLTPTPQRSQVAPPHPPSLSAIHRISIQPEGKRGGGSSSSFELNLTDPCRTWGMLGRRAGSTVSVLYMHKYNAESPKQGSRRFNYIVKTKYIDDLGIVNLCCHTSQRRWVSTKEEGEQRQFPITWFTVVIPDSNQYSNSVVLFLHHIQTIPILDYFVLHALTITYHIPVYVHS